MLAYALRGRGRQGWLGLSPTATHRTLRRRALIAGIVATCLLSGAGCSSVTTASAITAPPATDRFTAYVGPGNPSGLTAVQSVLGNRATLASDYFDDRSWSGIDNDKWDLRRWAGSGYRMVWGVPLLPATRGVSLAVGATGAYDKHFVLLAKRLVAANMGNAILRLGWEFNQKSYPWYAAGQPKSFVAYWQHVVSAMRSVHGSHFEFMWNPDRGDNGAGDIAMGNFANYYPGSGYVDIVGLDVYDSAWKSYPGAPAEFDSVVAQQWGLNWLAQFGTSEQKPVATPELGLGLGPSAPGSGPVVGSGAVGGGDDPVFISDMVNWSTTHGAVEVGFWDEGPSGMFDGRYPNTFAAVKSALASSTAGSPPTPG